VSAKIAAPIDEKPMNSILCKSIHTVATILFVTGGALAQVPQGAPKPQQPPVNQPPVNPPPVHQPPMNQPPVNQPPVNPPPVNQPPVNRPPVNRPPVNPPPVNQPPMNQPPVNRPPVNQPAPAGQRLGGPLAGLTVEERAAFDAGREEFVTAETRGEGLGPIFNNVSCVACHRAPAPGGAGRIFVTRFGRTTNGVFDPLAELGGSLLQQNGIAPGIRERVPRQANTVARRQTTPLFGLGLIEAIPDETIQQLADRPSVDGVTGRAAMVTDIASGETRVGRFGWKAQQATIVAFSADAYVNEMGITNRFFPEENAPNGNQELLARFDKVADPEDHVDPATGKDGVDMLTDFQRFLAPPAAGALTANGRAGKEQFTQIGCAICHVPEMQTGASPVTALDHKTVALYSDLLLHEMGALGDGIAQAAAEANEFRTPPLWGLRASAPYLHDGRAANVDAAIRAHDGEGKVARDRYVKLTPAQRAQLVEFLNSL
jgi:mono/diheme cytochrome c family protein